MNDATATTRKAQTMTKVAYNYTAQTLWIASQLKGRMVADNDRDIRQRAMDLLAANGGGTITLTADSLRTDYSFTLSLDF